MSEPAYRPWVFPVDTEAKAAIDLFDQIEAMPLNTPEEARAALKLIRKLNRMLKRMGLR